MYGLIRAAIVVALVAVTFSLSFLLKVKLKEKHLLIVIGISVDCYWNIGCCHFNFSDRECLLHLRFSG